MDHPDFISNPVYVSGDSYSGIPIPILAQDISNGKFWTEKEIWYPVKMDVIFLTFHMTMQEMRKVSDR